LNPVRSRKEISAFFTTAIKKCKQKKYNLFYGNESLAKKEMVCPFLGGLCKNCAIYIGRHYYLFDSTKYRGYIGRRKAVRKARTHHAFRAKPKNNFKIPVIKTEALDPFNTDP
jgi:hypothetical protein